MNFRFAEIAERHLTIGARSGPEFMCGCPHCESSGFPLQFNVNKGLYVCFRCGAKGSAKALIRFLGGQYSDPGASAEYLQASLDRLRISRRERKTHELPESTLLRYAGRPHDYWKERGFTDGTCLEWGLGYDPLSNRCTIPFRNSEGNLLGVIERRLDDGFPRYLYPKGFDRRGSLFGDWKCVGLSTVAVVEGALDAIKCWQAGVPAVAQYGSSISGEHVRLLKQMGVTTLVQFYDADKAGFRARYQCANAISDIRVLTVPWTARDYRRGNDPGSLPDRRIKELFDHAKTQHRQHCDTKPPKSSFAYRWECVHTSPVATRRR